MYNPGKSRADLWSLAAIVAVEWGIETNNMKCEDATSSPGECHHLQGEAGCQVLLERNIPFRSGRADCLSEDTDRPYIAPKEEVHADSMGDGRQTLDFFQENFGFNGQETVAIMGAHTFGRLNVHNSLFRYVWTSRGTQFFNNDYYKMIVDETRWFYNDNECTKVGDAYNNKPVRRWTTHFRSDTANRGPVHWISESYVCPNCVQETDHTCCQNVPQGLFCTPDAQNLTDKTPNQFNHAWENCETFKFISGIDEMALTCEMGLYFDFQNNNGFPTGCPGFETFDGQHGVWSEVNGKKGDPECPLQSLARPADDHSTSWYIKEYAANQDRWLADFVNVFDKMMTNGYGELEEEQLGDILCSRGSVSQCWREGQLEEGAWLLSSQLDGRLVTGTCKSSNTVMKTRDDTDSLQRWRIRRSNTTFQLVNVGSGKLMSTGGISDFTWGLDSNGAGFSTLRAAGGVIWDVNTGDFVAADRGWTKEDGVQVISWKEHGADNQRFKLELLENAGPATSPCL